MGSLQAQRHKQGADGDACAAGGWQPRREWGLVRPRTGGRGRSRSRSRSRPAGGGEHRPRSPHSPAVRAAARGERSPCRLRTCFRSNPLASVGTPSAFDKQTLPCASVEASHSPMHRHLHAQGSGQRPGCQVVSSSARNITRGAQRKMKRSALGSKCSLEAFPFPQPVCQGVSRCFLSAV